MNHTKIAKLAHSKSSNKVLLEQAKRDVIYYKSQIERYTKKQDLYYLNQAKECLEMAEAAVIVFKNKLNQ